MHSVMPIHACMAGQGRENKVLNKYYSRWTILNGCSRDQGGQRGHRTLLSTEQHRQPTSADSPGYQLTWALSKAHLR